MSSIKDVAKYAGVSVATVSRVINHMPNVRPETIEKVNDAIRACRFVPNALARNLKSEQTKIIGFLVINIANSYFSVMAKILAVELREKGYELMIYSSNDDPNLEKIYLDQLLSNQAAGIILNTTGRNEDTIAQISQTIPVVLIERNLSTNSFRGDFVGANNYGGIFELTRYLQDFGHRRIGFINGNPSVSTGAERHQGFVDAMKLINIEVDERYPYQCNTGLFTEQHGYESARQLMNLPKPPTALIGANNMISIGILKYIKQQRYQVPGDVSVVCYGNIENSELFFVNITYTTLNPVTNAKKACGYILSRLENRALPNRETIFESGLCEGESVGTPDRPLSGN